MPNARKISHPEPFINRNRSPVVEMNPPSDINRNLPLSEPQAEQKDVSCSQTVLTFIKKYRVVISSVLIFVTCLLLLILIPISFSYVEWDEWAFRKDVYNNKVHLSDVYTNGRYFWGIGKTKLTFSNLYHQEEAEFSIAASNGQEFNLFIKYNWRPKKNELKNIYLKFGTTISQQVSNRANSAIKNVAPTFTINEYIQNRTTIPNTLYASLFAELSNIGVDVPREGFHLHDVDIPDKVTEINLNTAVQSQTNILRYNEQLAVGVRAETERLDQEIRANTTFLNLQTDAQISRLVVDAKTESNRITAEADGNGIKDLFTSLNVTDEETKKKFFQFFVLINAMNPTF